MRSVLSLIASMVLGLLLLTSCEDHSILKIPKGIIPKDSMAMILTDIHLVEGAKIGNSIMGDDNVSADVYYQKVYNKYHTTKTRFEQSFQFYSDNPSAMNDIYDTVIENLNKISLKPVKPDASKPEEKKEISPLPADSVKKILKKKKFL